VEQTPTKVLFPSPEADPEEDARAFALGEREIEWIKRGSRGFLVKQGGGREAWWRDWISAGWKRRWGC
ncbi:MAG: hypothetical protein ACK52I_09585, partial [Pseudomonadota bacterium]